MRLDITVRGTPKPKGSLRHVGKGRLVEQVKDKGWRAAVTIAAAGERDRAAWETVTDRPVHVTIGCLFTRPKTVRRAWPTTRSSGDADKLARLILDALTDAHIIRDDSQVTRLEVTKQYADTEGARITVEVPT